MAILATPIPRPRRTRAASPTQRLITRQQAAAEYGIPARSIYDLICRGLLPVVRLPDTRRIWLRRVDLDRLIESSIETIR
jgi:hypothetical protein